MALASNQYIGNPDFRGYIAKVAPEFLGYVGNDGGVNQAALNAAGGVESNYKQQSLNVAGANSAIKELYNTYNSLASGNSGGGGGGGGGGSSVVYAPKLDLASINASARAAAESAVNPYYTGLLNQFLAEQGQAKANQQTQYDTNVKNIQDTLANTLEANQVSQTRAGEDAALANTAENTKADQFQTDSGQQYTADRLAKAKAVANAGLTGGLGAQQGEALQAAHATTEQRSAEATQQAKNAIDLSKVRTFEDLARSSEQANTSATKGQTQEKFNLDTFLQQAANAETDKRNELEQQRQAAIQDNAKQQAKLQFNNWLSTIKNPAQYLAAVQTYGGSF